MSNMPDVNKKFVTSLLPLELVAKIRKEAALRKMSTTEFIVFVLNRQLENLELTSEDCGWIAGEVLKNKAKRKEVRKGCNRSPQVREPSGGSATKACADLAAHSGIQGD